MLKEERKGRKKDMKEWWVVEKREEGREKEGEKEKVRKIIEFDYQRSITRKK